MFPPFASFLTVPWVECVCDQAKKALCQSKDIGSVCNKGKGRQNPSGYGVDTMTWIGRTIAGAPTPNARGRHRLPAQIDDGRCTVADQSHSLARTTHDHMHHHHLLTTTYC